MNIDNQFRSVACQRYFIILVVLCAASLGCCQTSDRGRVGQVPDYPLEYPLKEITALVLAGEPTVTMTGEYRAEISFTTAMPCPATRIYYGVYEPDQLLTMPRYRRSVKENLAQNSFNHRVTIDIRRLLGPALDITGLGKRKGGLIVYRIEIYNPARASAVLYDRRFAFHETRIIPTVIEGPFVDMVTETGAVISWETDQPVQGRVYANTRIYNPRESKPATHFEVSLSDLEPGCKYNYRVEIDNGEDMFSTREFYFQTPEQAATSFLFAVMGDCREGYGGGESNYGGVNYRVLNHFVTDAFNRGAEFIVLTGDLINGHTTSTVDFEMQLGAFKDAVEHVGHYIPIYEVMGNHEVVMDVYDDGSRSGIRFDKRGNNSSEALFARAFVNPLNGPEPEAKEAPTYKENVYCFDYGNSRFVIMNNNYWWSKYPERYGGNLEGYVLDDQTEWLKRVFAQAASDPNVEHLFLFAQEPMFPNGGHVQDGMWYNGGDPAKNNGIDRRYVVKCRDEIWQAFAATGKGVSGNFGDEHNYNRTLITSDINPDYSHPVWQIISGGAGAPFYAQNKNVPWAPFVEAFSTQMNYYLIRVDDRRILLEAYSVTGELIDEAVLVE